MAAPKRGRRRKASWLERDREAAVFLEFRASVVRLDETGSNQEQIENDRAFPWQVPSDRYSIKLEGLLGSVQLPPRHANESCQQMLRLVTNREAYRSPIDTSLRFNEGEREEEISITLPLRSS